MEVGLGWVEDQSRLQGTVMGALGGKEMGKWDMGVVGDGNQG